jgi:hypothetical protein
MSALSHRSRHTDCSSTCTTIYTSLSLTAVFAETVVFVRTLLRVPFGVL